MFVTQGQKAQTSVQTQLINNRSTRDQQKKGFYEILSQTGEGQPAEQLQTLANELEDEAFKQSNGENTREYRTRVNTIKMRLKGEKGKMIRQALITNVLSSQQLMAMDMNRISDEFIQQFLKETNKQIPEQQQVQKALPTKPSYPGAPNPRLVPPIRQVKQQFVQEPQQVIPEIQPEITQMEIVSNQVVPEQTEQDAYEDNKQEDQDWNFIQMQKNLEGMKRLAEQLEDENEYQQDQEKEEQNDSEERDVFPQDQVAQNEQEQVDGNENEYANNNENEHEHEHEHEIEKKTFSAVQDYSSNLQPLGSQNPLNVEFIKDDSDQNVDQAQGEILDQELRKEEELYYEEREQNKLGDLSEVQGNFTGDQKSDLNSSSEIIPLQIPVNQIEKKETTENNNTQNNNVVQSPNFTFKLEPQQEKHYPKEEIKEVQPQPSHQIGQQPPQYSPKVHEAVVQKLLGQKELMFQQQLMEVKSINEKLYQEISRINQQNQQQQVQQQLKNQQLSQENQLLRTENEILKEEIQKTRQQASHQIQSMHQTFEHQRNSWEEERELLVKFQASNNLNEYISSFQQEQSQLSDLLSEINQRSKIKTEQSLMYMAQRSTNIEQFQDNLNQFRTLLNKLTPISQIPRRSHDTPINDYQSQPVPSSIQSRTQIQGQTQGRTQGVQLPLQDQRSSEQQRVQEVRDTRSTQDQPRVYSHEEDLGYQNQLNIYADSGSTQTQGQQNQAHPNDQQSQIQRESQYSGEGGYVATQEHNIEDNNQERNQQQIQQEQSSEQVQQKIMPPPMTMKSPQTSQSSNPAQEHQEQVFSHPKLANKKPAVQNKEKPKAQQQQNPFQNQTITQPQHQDEQLLQGNKELFTSQQQVKQSQSAAHLAKQPVNVQDYSSNPQIQKGQPKKQTKRQEVPGALFD